MAGTGSRLHLAINPRRWAAVRRAVFQRDGYRCRACGRAGRLECDHVRPLRRGGALYALANLQSLCRDCHIAKSARESTKPDPERERWRALLRTL